MSLRKIFGRRTILEALRSPHTKVEKIILARGIHGTILSELLNEAETRAVPVEWMERRALDRLAGPTPEVTQGVMAILQGYDYADMPQLLSALPANLSSALLVVADEIEDPRNLGAIARCAEGAGAQGMIMTRHRSADLSPAAIKASSGALQHLAIVMVNNLAQALHELKQAGLWVAGLDAKAGQALWSADLKRPLALVVGNEGKGLRRLTQELCDIHLHIPMQGKIASFNVAVATGIALYEIQRQRQRQQKA